MLLYANTMPPCQGIKIKCFTHSAMLDGSDNDALLECMIAMLVQHDDKMFHAQWNGAYELMH